MVLYWALRLAFALSRRVPLSWQYRAFGLGCEVVYWCWPSKRRHTNLNMAVVLGARGWRDAGRGEQVPSGHAAYLARVSWRNYGHYIVDFLNLPALSKEHLYATAVVEGWEHLDQAVQAGKGVVLAGAHCGLWDYAPPVLAGRYPDQVHIVAEPFASQRVEDLVQGQRRTQGAIIVPMSNVRAMVRILRANGILGVLVDRPVAGDGIPITFFGRAISVPGGAGTLASLTGAALVPSYLHRRADGTLEGAILPPIEVPRTGNRAADVQRATQAVFEAVEGVILRDPRDWFMFRDLWGQTAGASGTGTGSRAADPAVARDAANPPAERPGAVPSVQSAGRV